MWRLVILAGALMLAACAPKPKPKPVVVKSHRDSLLVGCYTVDLFDPYRLEFPSEGVSREHIKFIGVWKDAAWNGEWCHDLYITDVQPDGTVTLLDAYGPYKKQNVEATVFKRTARLADGTLTFLSLGGASVSYKLSDDGEYLLGKRIDALGRYEITMLRHDHLAIPPIPRRRPGSGPAETRDVTVVRGDVVVRGDTVIPPIPPRRPARS
jgi:hypothetical protein